MRPIAGTRQRDEDAWPWPVVAAPRGFREIGWTLTVLVVPLLAMWVPGGWYALLSASMTAYLVRPFPRTLTLSAAMILAVSVATPFALGATSQPWAVMAQMLTRHTDQTEPPSVLVLRIGLTLAIATLTVAVVLGYDTRRVARGVVSDSVWNRQHLRRTQLLRGEARDNPPPLVCR